MLLISPQWIGLLIGVSECALSLSRRAKGEAVVKDRGSLALFWIVIPLAVALSIATAQYFRQLPLPFAPLPAVLGELLVVAGLALRWYAILYLGRWFTVNVAIAADQPLIDSGPYRRIRHPSYTGALLAMLGLALSIGNLPALFVLMLPIVPVFLRRIQVEEQVLAQAFGPGWEHYCARTWRLLPGLY